jgi:hypothetical protein
MKPYDGMYTMLALVALVGCGATPTEPAMARVRATPLPLAYTPTTVPPHARPTPTPTFFGLPVCEIGGATRCVWRTPAPTWPVPCSTNGEHWLPQCEAKP